MISADIQIMYYRLIIKARRYHHKEVYNHQVNVQNSS